MEESTSTLDPVDIITREAIAKMEPFTPEQWASQIFKAIALAKPRLQYINEFIALPVLTDELSKNRSSWFTQLAVLRQKMIDAKLDKQFGLSNRVVKVCELYPVGEERNIHIFLTQKGSLRVIIQRNSDEPSYIKRPFPDTEVWVIKNETSLAKFLTHITKSYRLIKPLIYKTVQGDDFGNIGFWVLDGIFGLIRVHENRLNERLAHFTATRETLSGWLDELAVVHKIRRD